MSLVLNSRPRPERDESFRGYLVRLSESNGFRTASDLTRRTGTSYSFEHGAPWTRTAQEMAVVLETGLLLASSSLDAHFQTTTPSLSELNDGQRRRIYRRGAAICPQCIQKEGYIASWLDNALMPICPKHACAVLNACPGCKAPIDLKRSSMDQCNDCGFEFSQMPRDQSYSNSLAYELIKRVYRGSLSMRLLLLACDRMARPGDFLNAAPNYSTMDLNDTMALVEQAAGLLLDKKFRDHYRAWFASYHHELTAVGPIPATHQTPWLKNTQNIRSTSTYQGAQFSALKHFPERCKRSESPITDALKLGIEVSRLRSWRNDVNHINLTTQVSCEQLSAWLEIKQAQVKSLVDNNIIPSINTVKTSRHLTFDINAVEEALRSVKVHPQPPEDAVATSEIVPLLPLFACSYAELIDQIVAGDIPVYGDNRFSGWMVSKGLAISALDRRLSACGEIAQLETIARIWGTSMKKLRELPEAFLERIARSHVSLLMDDWISLSRLSRVAGLRLNILRTKLSEANIRPVHEVSGSPQPLLLYRKHSAIDKVLAMYL